MKNPACESLEEEARLIVRFKSGDMNALGQLVDIYHGPMMSFLRRMVPSDADAQDLLQETWLRTLKHPDSFRSGKLLSWLFRVARNLVIDRSRTLKPTVTWSEQPAMEMDAALASPRRDGPDHLLVRREMRAHIQSKLDHLPSEQREVVILRLESGLPFRDIARIQGVSINTVLARMRYAVLKLRVELKELKGSVS